jgi:hypothetical protein
MDFSPSNASFPVVGDHQEECSRLSRSSLKLGHQTATLNSAQLLYGNLVLEVVGIEGIDAAIGGFRLRIHEKY